MLLLALRLPGYRMKILCGFAMLPAYYRTPPGDSLTYAWYRNGNILSGSTENELAVSQNGDYVVVVTDLEPDVPLLIRWYYD